MEFKEMKFRVENEEHSRKIQEALFEMGYYWEGAGKKIYEPKAPFLYTQKYTKGIVFGTKESTFLKVPNKECTLEDLTINYTINPPFVIAIKGNKIGIAKCNPKDEFDEELGKEIAKLRMEGKDNEANKLVEEKYSKPQKQLWQIKEWDEMVEEFGVDSDGNINCESTFVYEMKSLCGRIVDFEKRGLGDWFISSDMVKPYVVPEKFYVKAKTKKRWKEICEVFDKYDIEWSNGQNATEYENWDYHKNKSCIGYNGHLEFCDKKHYDYKNIQKVKFRDLDTILQSGEI